MTNRFGVSYSSDLVEWNIIEDVAFPSEARHGTVSIISADQAKKLVEIYGY